MISSKEFAELVRSIAHLPLTYQESIEQLTANIESFREAIEKETRELYADLVEAARESLLIEQDIIKKYDVDLSSQAQKIEAALNKLKEKR